MNARETATQVATTTGWTVTDDDGVVTFALGAVEITVTFTRKGKNVDVIGYGERLIFAPKPAAKLVWLLAQVG